MYCRFFIILLCSLIPGEPKEYCETMSFQPKCERDEVVIVTRATYGRMSLGECVKVDYGYVGCKTDVLGHLDNVCSGRRDCSIRIPDEDMGRKNAKKEGGCPSEFKTYLNASYICVKGETFCCYSGIVVLFVGFV